MNNCDEKSLGFNILAFFVPLVGLILFLVWEKEYPVRAKSIGISALVGFIVKIVFFVIIYIAVILLSIIYIRELAVIS